jgi:RND family efflux transporter MFP subunit
VWLVVGLLCAVLVGGTVLLRTVGAPAKPEANKAAKGAVVRVDTVKREGLEVSVEHRGELTADAAELAPQISGRLTHVRVNIGDRFAAGDLLARVDAIQADRQVVEARAEVRSSDASKRRAAAELASAKSELARGERLYAEQLITEQELSTLRSKVDVLRADGEVAEAAVARAKARVSVLRELAGEAKLVAPFAGAVSERYLDPGALVQPGTVVLRLVKSGPLRARFRAPERDLAGLKAGMSFEITTQATGDKRFRGKVTRVSAEVSRIDRTIAVEGVLDAEQPALRPGMYATVTLSLGKLTDANVIVGSALVEREIDGKKQTGVFLLEGDHAKWRAVDVAGRSGDRIAVTALAPGQTVLAFGHEALKDGARVRVADDSP